jgi:hypothetical protein
VGIGILNMGAVVSGFCGDAELSTIVRLTRWYKAAQQG